MLTPMAAAFERNWRISACATPLRGVRDEFTALQELVRENYGERVLNTSPDSIYTGALGAALFARRAAERRAA
jgi:hypothetical protein